ncbi:ArsC/Spx/MgsR family protein [Lactococcus garvieae]|uniref:ArsC/Spx/MgsR family protein n=1 Tax=Lactococcus garvieae TaxID=1363 RepID=UPI0022E17F1A|nr:ArsC/Spx/MgsR family protein [Lactococcus garvieae]
MITIYYRKTCTSSRRAIQWLNDHNIEYQLNRVEKIRKEDILLSLSMSENGIDDIVKLQGNAITQKKVVAIYGMSLSAAIDYLKRHTEVLRTPIILSKNKLLIGFHETEIRQFISRDYRQVNYY